MKIKNILILVILIVFIQGCMSSYKRYSIEEIQEKAILGDRESQYRLAIFFEQNKNYSEALKWYEKSASLACVVSQNELGNIYKEHRLGLKQDYNKAIKYYEEASRNGYFDAINNLAYMHDLGLGIKQNRIKAVELYKIAASKGSIRAMYNLGLSYIDGFDEIEKDFIQAYMWLDLARYYTGMSKDMTLKWSIRARLDELDRELTSKERSEAKGLASEWIREQKNHSKNSIEDKI